MANKKKNLFIVFFFTILISSCGFKKVGNVVSSFNVQEINISGNKKIGYSLKNEILLNSSKTNENKIIIYIDTDKKKQISERNIKKKTTKYEVIISTELKVDILKTSKILTKTFTKSFIYDVEKNHSKSLMNEKEDLDDLTLVLAEDIKNYLNTYFN